MIAGAEYREVNDHGLRYSVDGVEQLLEVDHVIVCTGQEPERICSSTSSASVSRRG